MKKVLILLTFILAAGVSSVDPIKNSEKNEARRERRLERKKFDNRSREQKLKDFKVLSFILFAGIIVFNKVDQ